MMGWYGHDWGFGGWIGMGLGMVVFWGLVIFGIVALVRWVGSDRSRAHDMPDRPATTDRTALQILDERFARGDLTVEEYQQHRTVLTGR